MDWMESIDVVPVDENKAISGGSVGGDGMSKVQPTVMSPVLMTTAATTVTGVGVLAGGG